MKSYDIIPAVRVVAWVAMGLTLVAQWRIIQLAKTAVEVCNG